MTRHIKRGGKIWIRVFPDKPITKKPLEVRQGKGKGNVEYWVCQIQPGKMLYEMEGWIEDVAREAFRWPRQAAVQDNLRETDGDVMKASELREKSVEELNETLLKLREGAVQAAHAGGDWASWARPTCSAKPARHRAREDRAAGEGGQWLSKHERAQKDRRVVPSPARRGQQQDGQDHHGA